MMRLIARVARARRLASCREGIHDDEVIYDDGAGVEVRCRQCGRRKFGMLHCS